MAQFTLADGTVVTIDADRPWGPLTNMTLRVGNHSKKVAIATFTAMTNGDGLAELYDLVQADKATRGALDALIQGGE